MRKIEVSLASMALATVLFSEVAWARPSGWKIAAAVDTAELCPRVALSSKYTGKFFALQMKIHRKFIGNSLPSVMIRSVERKALLTALRAIRLEGGTTIGDLDRKRSM
jgi:hypothetical protein